MIDMSDENIIKKIKAILDLRTISNYNLLAIYLNAKKLAVELDQEKILPEQ